MVLMLAALMYLAQEELLITALDQLNERNEIVLAGTVKQEEAGEGFAQMIVISSSGGGGGEELAGPFHAWRTEEGEWVIATQQTLPGMVHYDDGERTVTQVAFEETPLSTSTVTSDLTGLLDLDRLRGAVKKAELKHEVDEQTGNHTFRGEISKRVVSRGTGSPLQIMAPQVLRLEAQFVVNEEGALASMKFTVGRSDPMASLKKKALDGDLDGGMTVSTGVPEVSDEEDQRSVYVLTMTHEDPGERLNHALKQIRYIMKSEVF